MLLGTPTSGSVSAKCILFDYIFCIFQKRPSLGVFSLREGRMHCAWGPICRCFGKNELNKNVCLFAECQDKRCDKLQIPPPE